MPTRAYWIPALILWFASIGWLFTTKVLPAFTTGSPPDYQALLPKTMVKEPDPVRWSIRWNGKEIGSAENRISRQFDGTGRLASEVRFEQLPVDQLMRDMLGILGGLAKGITGEIGPIDLEVFTDLHFDNYGQLSRFETKINVGSLEELLRIDGLVKEDTLDLSARLKSDGENATEVYRKKELKLPPDAMVADTFSPRPQLANLKLGQSWTFQSYQPFMPHSPLTLIEARVVGEELIEWNGMMTRAKKVVFQKDSGSGISSTRRPVSETWVIEDGTVLRQDLWMANVKVQFVRLPNEETPKDSAATKVDTEATAVTMPIEKANDTSPSL